MEAEHERAVADVIALTEIPSPPFGEEKRAAAYLEMLRAHGLEEVRQDEIGNVMGIRRGYGNGEMLVVAAHLDTVFPAGTDVRVRREGTKLFAPGQRRHLVARGQPRLSAGAGRGGHPHAAGHPLPRRRRRGRARRPARRAPLLRAIRPIARACAPS